MSAADVLAEVGTERERQESVWGEQNHPDGTGPNLGAWGRYGSMSELASEARRVCDRHAAAGTLTWFHILREEYAEAMAEDDPAKLRAELIQVAAVAVQWVAAIDRRAP